MTASSYNISDAETMYITATLGNLREAYAVLAAETVVKQKELADGLIAPSIRRLEAMLLDRDNTNNRSEESDK